MGPNQARGVCYLPFSAEVLKKDAHSWEKGVTFKVPERTAFLGCSAHTAPWQFPFPARLLEIRCNKLSFKTG